MAASTDISPTLRLLAGVKILKAAVTHPLTPSRLIIDGKRGTVEVVPDKHEQRKPPVEA